MFRVDGLTGQHTQHQQIFGELLPIHHLKTSHHWSQSAAVIYPGAWPQGEITAQRSELARSLPLTPDSYQG